MNKNLCEILSELVNKNPKVVNFRFYKNAKMEHGHNLLKREVGDFFRKFHEGDGFFETYKYISGKEFSILKILDRDAFLLFLEKNKTLVNAKEQIEKAMDSGNGKTQNYNMEYKFPIRALNILLYNNSKENNYIDKSRSYLVKSREEFFINGTRQQMDSQLLDLVSCSFFSNEKLNLRFKGSVVLIENKESYDFAETVFGESGHLFMLYGGNASEREHEFIAKNIHCDKIIYFCDFDYISLKEYNKLKSHNKKIELFYGGDLKELESKIEKYGNRDLFLEQEKNQEYIMQNFDEISKLIWRLILKHEKALEQEIFHAPEL